MFSGVSQGLFLIAFGLGYFVIFMAKKGDRSLQFLGYFAGTLLMLLSLIFLVNSLMSGIDFYPSLPQKMMFRHMLPAY